MFVFASQEWSPSHNLKSLRKKQLATREAMARQTVVSDTELSIAESSVIRYGAPFPATSFAVPMSWLGARQVASKGISRSRLHSGFEHTLFGIFVHAQITEEFI